MKRITVIKLILLPMFLLIFLLGSYPVSAATATVTLPNLIGTESITEFLQSVMQHLQGIIAYLAILFTVIGGILYLLSSGSEGMVRAAKICWTAAIVGFALAAAAPSFLREIKAILLKDNQMPQTLEEALTVKEIVMNTLSFLLSILGILGIIGLVISGIFYIFSFGNATRIESAKNAMKYSLLGIVTAGASLLVIKEIAILITG